MDEKDKLCYAALAFSGISDQAKRAIEELNKEREKEANLEDLKQWLKDVEEFILDPNNPESQKEELNRRVDRLYEIAKARGSPN